MDTRSLNSKPTALELKLAAVNPNSYLNTEGKTEAEINNVATKQATRNLFKAYQIAGITLPNKHKILYLMYSCCLHFFITFCGPLTFTLSYIYFNNGIPNIGNLLTSLQVCCNVYGCSIKFCFMAFNKQKLREMEPLMERLDVRCKGKFQINELHNMVHLGNRLVQYVGTSFETYAGSTFLCQLIMGRPPFNIFLPYLYWSHSTWELVLVSCIEYFLMACTCFMQMCNDAYPLVYITILRSHIKNLLNRVENLCMDPNMTKAQNIEELKNCIKDHQNLIEFFNRISPLISVTVFIQFITSASAMAMTLINLMIFAIDFSARIASIFYFIAILTETFPLCYFAQMLMDDNNKLADTIFHSNWMGQDVAYTKMLLFFLQRSQAMMELTAGKLVPITLNSFLGSAKFSFSLYTFVKQMDTKGKFGVH